jgi:nucleoside-diphosphate-sugar epimerase
LALAPPDEINQVNAEGTRIVLEESAKANVRRLVYVSTTAVYGMPRYHPIDEGAPSIRWATMEWPRPRPSASARTLRRWKS